MSEQPTVAAAIVEAAAAEAKTEAVADVTEAAIEGETAVAIVEAQTEAAVAIAKVNADAQVAIAETSSEGGLWREELQSRMTSLETMLLQQGEQLGLIQGLLTPPVSPEPPPEPPPEPGGVADPTASLEHDASPEPPRQARLKRRWT